MVQICVAKVESSHSSGVTSKEGEPGLCRNQLPDSQQGKLLPSV